MFRMLHMHNVSAVAFNSYNKILEQLFKIIISLSFLVCSSSSFFFFLELTIFCIIHVLLFRFKSHL